MYYLYNQKLITPIRREGEGDRGSQIIQKSWTKRAQPSDLQCNSVGGLTLSPQRPGNVSCWVLTHLTTFNKTMLESGGGWCWRMGWPWLWKVSLSILTSQLFGVQNTVILLNIVFLHMEKQISSLTCSQVPWRWACQARRGEIHSEVFCAIYFSDEALGSC